MESNLGELVGRDQEGVVGLAIDVAEEIAEIAVGAAAGVVVAERASQATRGVCRGDPDSQIPT